MSINFFELNHRARVSLAAEIHSRPFLKLNAPELISHLAVYPDALLVDGNASAHELQHATLSSLCAHFAVAPPAFDAKYFYVDFGAFRLKWECHTEFASYTFAQHRRSAGNLEQALQHMPIRHVPESWLAHLQGQILVAAHVILDARKIAADEWETELQHLFKGNSLAACQTMQGGEFWSDFVVHADGFSRFVIRDVDMRAQQTGRLTQRILEIETYRMMALLGLPIAQKTTPQLNAIENSLVELASAMVESDHANDGHLSDFDQDHDSDSERHLLEKITHLAARIEKLSLENNYRFSASKAYFSLVLARIEELREERLQGLPMVAEFMDRRLRPAMNTCDAVANRQEALARRIAHSNDLLRTRVGIVQEMQNRQILQSMNARAAQQLHLQQAVEGLSVAAISYYVIGLFGYVAKAAKEVGWLAHTESAVGIMVPVVLGCVWWGLRRMHQSIKSK